MDINITAFVGEDILKVQEDTNAIQSALDTVSKAGGGKVILTSGNYLIGSILMRSNCTLYLQKNTTVKGIRDLAYYDLGDKLAQLQDGRVYLNSKGKKNASIDPFSRWSRALIKFLRVENCGIEGEENVVFDGSNVYDELGEEKFRGPHFVNAHESKNIFFKNYTLTDSSNWGHAIFTSKNILCKNLTIIAGHDGVDFLSCDDVLVEDCTISSGDDCVAGFDLNNLLVRNCDLNTACNALRIGGNNLVIDSCNIHGPGKYGHRNFLVLADKIAGVRADISNARTNMLTCFNYYCDFRYSIRKPTTGIVIKNCKIDKCDKIFRYDFTIDDVWMINKPMQELIFENNVVADVKETSSLISDEQNLFEFSMRNCKIDLTSDVFIETDGNSKLTFENVEFTGNKPVVCTKKQTDKILCINCKVDVCVK